MRSADFDRFAEGELLWLPERGMGWFPVTTKPYDAGYWHRYRQLDRTETGAALTRARCALVARHMASLPGRLVDVGIGGGRFVEATGARGFDVNPAAVDWLKARGLWLNPYQERIHAASFWDSLEHIHEPAAILDRVDCLVFVSIPIFSGPEHVIRSKHFRKDEHCFYFTRAGFLRFMALHGFEVLEVSSMEQDCGREDIESFAFRRAS